MWKKYIEYAIIAIGMMFGIPPTRDVMKYVREKGIVK